MTLLQRPELQRRAAVLQRSAAGRREYVPVGSLLAIHGSQGPQQTLEHHSTTGGVNRGGWRKPIVRRWLLPLPLAGRREPGMASAGAHRDVFRASRQGERQ